MTYLCFTDDIRLVIMFRFRFFLRARFDSFFTKSRTVEVRNIVVHSNNSTPVHRRDRQVAMTTSPGVTMTTSPGLTMKTTPGLTMTLIKKRRSPGGRITPEAITPDEVSASSSPLLSPLSRTSKTKNKASS